MHQHNHEENHDHTQDAADGQLGPGYSYLSNALKVSFILLKIIMVVLIGLFIASGFRTIGHDEQALVLRFGKIRGIGEERLLGPGLKWVMPYPVDEIIRIPTQRKINVPLNLFWYYQKPGEEMGETAKEKSPPTPTLNPLTDGYCLVRGEKQSQATAVPKAVIIISCIVSGF